MPSEPDVLTVVRAALAEIKRQRQLARQAIKAATDVDRALEASKELYVEMREAADSDGNLRTETAGRVWHAHRLSLSALAERVGISKSRAEQLIKEVKKSGEQL